MAMVINTNIASLNAQRNLRKTESPLETAMQRLSSGLRINSAKDDAAGLAIATRMDAQVRGLTVAIRNANDGLSFAQTAEGAVTEMVADVERMYELAVQATSYNTPQDRNSMNDEVKELISELDRVVTQTRFNGEQFLNKQVSWAYQVGTKVDETITLSTRNLAPTALGVTTTYDQKFNESDVALSTWSIYKTAENGGFRTDTKMNGVQLGGAIAPEHIMNNSREIIERLNKYGDLTNTKATSFGNSLIATEEVSMASNGVAAQSGFITVNGVAIGSISKSELSEDQKRAIREDVDANGKAEIEAKSAQLQANREAITADYLKKIKNGSIQRKEDQKGLSDEELAKTLTNDHIENGAKEEVVNDRARKLLAADTAKKITVVINDKATETGVKAYVVSNARLVLSNSSGAAINVSMDESRYLSEAGDATKDLKLGFNNEGSSMNGGQNGLIVLSDKRFGVGSVEFDSERTTALFGYGMATRDGTVVNLQNKREISELISLNKKAIADLTIDTADNAKLTMMVSEQVLDVLNSFKSTLGAKMNRIDSTIRNLDNVRENVSAAKSRILDADFAAETANMTKSMILQQAGMSILSQANSHPNNVLSLLQRG